MRDASQVQVSPRIARSLLSCLWVPITLSRPLNLVALCRMKTFELGIWLREALALRHCQYP